MTQGIDILSVANVRCMCLHTVNVDVQVNLFNILSLMNSDIYV